MDAIQALIVRHLKDPTTYAGIAAILLTYLPASVTGIDASQWQQAMAGIVGLALIWIDGRMNSTRVEALRTAQVQSASKGFGSNVALTGMIVLGIIGLALSGCAALSKGPTGTATTVAQADVQWGCLGAQGAMASIVPSIPIKAGSDGAKAVASLQSLIGIACDPTHPLDPSNYAQDYVALMSLTGQVLAIAAAPKP